jgi:hypothetical protein
MHLWAVAGPGIEDHGAPNAHLTARHTDVRREVIVKLTQFLQLTDTIR